MEDRFLYHDTGMLILDIHTATACKLFQVFPEDVTFEMRRVAKVRNFSELYGCNSFNSLLEASKNTEGKVTRVTNFFIQSGVAYRWLKDVDQKLVEQALIEEYSKCSEGKDKES